MRGLRDGRQELRCEPYQLLSFWRIWGKSLLCVDQILLSLIQIAHDRSRANKAHPALNIIRVLIQTCGQACHHALNHRCLIIWGHGFDLRPSLGVDGRRGGALTHNAQNLITFLDDDRSIA